MRAVSPLTADAHGTNCAPRYLDAPVRPRDEEVAARGQRQHPARVVRLVNGHLQREHNRQDVQVHTTHHTSLTTPFLEAR